MANQDPLGEIHHLLGHQTMESISFKVRSGRGDTSEQLFTASFNSYSTITTPSSIFCRPAVSSEFFCAREMTWKVKAAAGGLQIFIWWGHASYLALLFPTYFDKTTPTSIFLTISWVSIRILGPGCRWFGPWWLNRSVPGNCLICLFVHLVTPNVLSTTSALLHLFPS